MQSGAIKVKVLSKSKISKSLSVFEMLISNFYKLTGMKYKKLNKYKTMLTIARSKQKQIKIENKLKLDLNKEEIEQLESCIQYLTTSINKG